MPERAHERPPHGGRVREAAVRYGIPLASWLDLSTGINPDGWPVPEVPRTEWSRLPEEEDGLRVAAADYYGSEALLPVAGSQVAIQALPRLRSPCRVAVIAPGYHEHAHAWRGAGHRVVAFAAHATEAAAREADVLVLSHPNNPTGASFAAADLLAWRDRLAARGGWLVVDEAFIDATPEASLCPHGALPGMIVLRSLGKFFGLAGARVGFVFAGPEVLRPLDAVLGPWTIARPARWLATAALVDRAWQRAARRRLRADSARLRSLLACHGLAPDGGCALFQWTATPRAAAMHEALARQGILTRPFTAPASLRFGLPGCESDWVRLDAALAKATADLRRGVPA